jgi:hypothetical protein
MKKVFRKVAIVAIALVTMSVASLEINPKKAFAFLSTYFIFSRCDSSGEVCDAVTEDKAADF